MESGRTTQRVSAEVSPCMADRYRRVRERTHSLAENLTPEDACVQSMTDASPAKWHLAHTTWFFERFVLAELEASFTPHDDRFEYLFNSYYNAVGARQPRHLRGLLTRPSFDEVIRYRDAVDDRVERCLASLDEARLRQIAPVVEIGINHEQQHQELMLTDIRHLLWCSPLRPAFRSGGITAAAPRQEGWLRFEGGVIEIGNDQPPFPEGTFAFDNELPAHKSYLQPYEFRRGVVTNGEYLEFIRDGGYTTSDHWLDDGWAAVQREGWEHPLYWERDGRSFAEFTLAGTVPIDEDRPVCSLSLFEADAFARWSDARLPTEEEWEHAATGVSISGNTVETGELHPVGMIGQDFDLPAGLYGDVWEWTGSQYRPYPGYRPPSGAIGEYNGKFMCNQFVLRGGSCASAADHLRVTYRNFFPPAARWQFAGLRLARDL